MFWAQRSRPHPMRTNTASNRRRQCRPMLESLEDRWLLSSGFAQLNLTSDVPGLARVTDPDLVNPWGIAFSPTGPFWFAENGGGVSDILDGRGKPLSLIVTVRSGVRSDSAPTGTVFNAGSGFVMSVNGVSAPSRFLFAGEDGTISGWTSLVDQPRAHLVVDNSSRGAVYTGLTLATPSLDHSFLYAADFGRGTIDVFDSHFHPIVNPAAFQDPNLPHGYAPFTIQNINNLLFVAYALRAEEDNDAAGGGVIDIYDPSGSLLRRFASAGALDSPWGLAAAPSGFGSFGGALLVGNNGDGRIIAYDAASGTMLGQLPDDNGTPISIPDLWALTFGNGHAGGDSNTLFFTAGLDEEQHGLFGAIQAPGRRNADTAGPGVFDPHAPGEPGDYPLPPRDGPAFRASSSEQLVPTVDLLPLRETSLLLIPTLSTTTRSSTRSPVSLQSTAMLEVAIQPFPMPVPTPSGNSFRSAQSDSPPGQSAGSSAGAFMSFLDVRVTGVSQTSPPLQPLRVVVGRSTPPADSAAKVHERSVESHIEILVTQVNEE